MREHVAASTQNQVLAALLFLYDKVLNRRLSEIGGVVRARQPRRLPVVLTRQEVRAVLGALDGTPRLVCMLLYTHVLPGREGGQKPGGRAGGRLSFTGLRVLG